MAGPLLRRLVADLPSWTLGFDPRPANKLFVMDKVALGQIFLHVLFIYPVDAIHQTLRTNPSNTDATKY